MNYKRLLSNGFRPRELPLPFPKFYWFESSVDRQTLIGKLRQEGNTKIAVILPTYLARTGVNEHIEVAREISNQLHLAKGHLTTLFICMQWVGDEERLAETRLSHIIAAIDRSSTVSIVGVCMEGAFKALSLNICFQAAKEAKFDAVGWVDDDVKLGEACLKNLIERFNEKRFQGAVGAFKVPFTKPNAASRVLRKFKEVTRPSMNYPHGCCMFVDMEIVSQGIPTRYYTCEDGYVCFEMIRRDPVNPFGNLEIVQAAICTHWVGGPVWEILARVRRIILNHLVLMADYPSNVSKIYFEKCLFTSFWSFRSSFPKDIVRNFLQTIYFLLFLYYCLLLIARSLVGLPLRNIAWDGYKIFKR